MSASRGSSIVLRLCAGVGGGYAFTWGFTSFGIALLVAAGMPYGEARTLVYLLAFLVFLTLLLWAFAARSTKTVGLVLGGGGALMTAGAWGITRALA